MIAEREETRAEIVESYDARTIKIRVAGKHCRDFMTLIAEQFDQINKQYEKMQVDKLIPCNCAECQVVETPYFFEYKKLQRRLEKGRQEIECEQSFEMVNVRSLIDDVINTERRRDRPEKSLHGEIVNFLTALPNTDRKAFEALLKNAGLDQALLNQIAFDGAAAQFCPILVDQLSKYGALDDGRSALAAVLSAANNLVGEPHKSRCERLIQRIEAEDL